MSNPPLNICQLQGLDLQLGLGWLGRRQTAKDHSFPLINESLVSVLRREPGHWRYRKG